MLEEHHFRLKVHRMCHGIRLTPAAIDVLSNSGTAPITIHEYATTGGVTLRIGDMYLNAPFDDWYCDSSRAMLDVDESRQFHVVYEGVVTPCEVLPLPGYLEAPTRSVTRSRARRCRTRPHPGVTDLGLHPGLCVLHPLQAAPSAPAEAEQIPPRPRSRRRTPSCRRTTC